MARSRTTAFWLGAAAAAASPALLLAQEHAEEAGGNPLFAVNPGLIIWTWVLFGFTLLILWRWVFPAISGGLEERHAKIQASIDEAHRARDDAKALLAEQKETLEKARAQAQETIEKARAVAEGARKEILAEAKEQQEALLEDARREMGHERERLREDLRREVVEVSIAVAERLIRVRLDGEENRRLVEELVGEI